MTFLPREWSVVIVEVEVSNRSMSKTSTGMLVSVTAPVSSICHFIPTVGFQWSPGCAAEDVVGDGMLVVDDAGVASLGVSWELDGMAIVDKVVATAIDEDRAIWLVVDRLEETRAAMLLLPCFWL
jgi:hypothetical protein